MLTRHASYINRRFTSADVLAMKLPVEVPTLGDAMLKIEKSNDGTLIVGGKYRTLWQRTA